MTQPFPHERQEQVNRITEWLLDATSEIGDNYFQLPVAGKEEPEYRERVYCYELYHQWRSLWTENCPFSLCGEIDKAGHPIIRMNDKPDFLVHVPIAMDKNLIIVEVKPSNANKTKMVTDLKKLVWFRGEPANYEAAYFLVYGLPIADWGKFKDGLLRKLNAEDSVSIREKVICIIHERADERAQIMSWEN